MFLEIKYSIHPKSTYKMFLFVGSPIHDFYFETKILRVFDIFPSEERT